MSTRETIEPLALAARGRTLEGRLPISSLPRLLPLLATDEQSSTEQGDVEYLLEFGVDEGKSPRITGWVKATLPLMCQRCMETMGFPVLTRTRLGIVSSRAAAQQLPECYDPLLVLDAEITVASIIEDELILALPQVAVHNDEECPQGEAFLNIGDGQEDATTMRRENPFAVLSRLRTSRSGKND
ncbi:MAG: hypothetical protein GXP18_13605 [Gammaproteobacteria bacterium]|nr:hypothetical protein [Gammaproteobacteria bacterium]